MHSTFASVLFFTWNVELILIILDMTMTRAVLKLQSWANILDQSEEIQENGTGQGIFKSHYQSFVSGRETGN